MGVVLAAFSLTASPFLHAIHAKPEAVGRNGETGIANLQEHGFRLVTISKLFQ